MDLLKSQEFLTRVADFKFLFNYHLTDDR